MGRRCGILKIVGTYRYRRKRNHALRPNCFGETWLFSYVSWTNKKFQALGSLDKCWRTSTTSTTTPRSCRSKKRMSATTRRENWRKQKQLYKPIHPSKQIRPNSGNGTRSSRETCRILRLRRPRHGWIPHGNVGIHGGGILQNLTKSSEWFFFKKIIFQQCMQVRTAAR